MDLRGLEGVWNRLGRRDPYWAALTCEQKRDGRWSEEDFFRLGDEEIEARLRHAAERGWGVRRERALDFGCGAGRLTQALAARFASVDGVDIAPSMIELARRHNRHGDRCRYHVNGDPDLRMFPDGIFDFVYSTLVIQHIPPPYSSRYIRELIRVVAPGGLLVFQLPSHRTPVEPSRDATSTVAAGALPRSAFRAEIVPEDTRVTARAGESFLLSVTVRNASDHTWPSGGREDGLYVVQLANRWVHLDGAMARPDDGRVPLPHDVAPGQEARLFLPVRAPEVNGEYDIRLDLVQEHVAWFEERGSSPARVRCLVEGGLDPAPREARRPRFGERHPNLRRALVAMGLDAVRLTIGRARERFEAVRREPTMVMYCIPRAEVTECVEASGGQLLEVEQELLPDGFQSCRYWITRAPTIGAPASSK
jgi:SAM-dependent methyltransferase